MADRFYLPHYELAPDRPVYLEDIGSLLFISGVVLQGMGSTLVLVTPSGQLPEDLSDIRWEQPDLADWGAIIKQSDNPEIFVGEIGGLNKILHRKQRYAISGSVQQKIWARDECRCVFCNRKIGDVLITVDHWVPLEQGGVNDETNYVTACRPCNKSKGMLMPADFCRKKGFDYDRIRLKVYDRGVLSAGGVVGDADFGV
jgi:hypothetical protein